MNPSRYAFLLPLAMAAACSAGTTMRVAQDDPNDEAVSLAPTPEVAATDSTAAADTGTAASPSLETAAAPQAQGYAGYDNSAALEVRRIGQWTRTGIGESRRLVIRDANAWAEFWSELGVGAKPAVDFNKDIVIAVAAGQRSTGGYEIRVDQVRQNQGELVVEVVETAPGPNCMTTASLTQPVDVVLVPAVKAQSWSFTERKDVRGCR
jgi:PrcB C-terminal